MAISGNDGCLLSLFLTVLLKVIVAQNYQVTFTIEEERAPDSFVGDVSNSFSSNIPREEIGHIKYGFLQQNYIQTLLTLQQTSGILSTAVVIDRESKTVCQSQALCSFNFDIAVRSSRPQSSFFEIISVTLIIEDINDNAPLFPHSLVLLDIPESATVGTSFHIDSAIDLDAGTNSVQAYEIGQQNGNFSLDVIRKLDGSFTVKLVLKSLLDRESKDKYNVVIIAMDGGNPKKFGAVSVNITVTDANDNAPIFTQTNYNITVRENVTIGSTVLTVTARDKDIGNNGKITYRLSKNQLDARVNNIFEISQDDGELKLKDKLVYESGTSYKIIVEASDNGKQPHVTQAIVKVYVIDVGNNPPSLQINLLEQGNTKFKNILESANPGTFVAHINVVDTDTNENGEVECEISDKKFELLRMGRKGYKAVVKSKLDRETQDLHNIIVSCHDFGTPSLTASSSFLVSILDENDCAPIFTRPIFTGIIPENHKEFRTFVQIIAFDEDLDKNGEVRYYVDEESTPYKFWINERDGSLRADQVFDREETPVITFKVIARDLGKPSLSNKATVQLTIEDKNDNAPRIDNPKNFSVTENKNSGSLVGILTATDIDEGKNAQIMFVIKPEFEFSVPFVVFPDGTIKTNRQLDREEKSNYVFTVVVFDQGTPRLKSSANVTISVTDTNDNAPKLYFPVASNKTVVVLSDVNPGYKVTQIEARDVDEGVNTIISYDITSGNEDDLFVIDNKLGGIYLTKAVEITKNRTFNLKIAVKDGGHPQHTTHSDLKIIMVRAINATSQLRGDDNNSNTLIVVIVVILTAVLSIVMIMVICFLRRFDHRSKARKNLDIVAPDEKYPKCYMEDPSHYLDNAKDSHEHLTLSYEPMSNMMSLKRKEVSFDIDDHSEHSNSRDNHNTTMSTFSVPESEKFQGMSVVEEGEESVPNSKQGRLNKLQMLQYHQAILESQTRAWLQTQEGQEEGSSFEVTLPDDKCSDTSEEVTASDSGKGGSEDDIPSSHSKDLKTRVHGVIVPPGKFQTRHYVAPEFRRQGSLQRKACDINFEDNRVHSPVSPLTDDLSYRPESRASLANSLANSTPRPNSRAAMFYPNDHSFNRTLDSVGDHATDWDSASYV
ncbi:protocadherin beta-15-like [Mercenaria mercenaria]|uniref:protocadherin beta-15-like n=1 Tax=Mercenaria mercenaria TaxID=6596 RepID=UPI00234E8AC8|nr:protocadherin beta-15-like [Mercenaria mercenaria]XP_053400229.1 protocadherin beta-15-like [Mercenaria mercenaria]XP_053400230.1 protocadherin beta-15-like [Mercenaria mercenaria]XP_053400231.1 protocadherin beta-15-like [Mercenaria mercenaria]XP_053400232.1 protocadherin beta-15-like [Mercenaria mercenaria]